VKPFFTEKEILDTQPGMHWNDISKVSFYLNAKVQPLLEENERLKEELAGYMTQTKKSLKERITRLEAALNELAWQDRSRGYPTGRNGESC